jgi:hypothetical protein
MSDELSTCYCCDAPATSEEHAPPKCLFPEMKDTGGIDYRKQLITVPSCDRHNTGKSKDDEYLLVMLAIHFENNAVAEAHCRHKIRRALQHSDGLYRYFANRSRKVSHPSGAKAVAVHVDMDRFVPALCSVVRAVHFAHLRRKLPLPLQIFTLALRGPDVALWNKVAALLAGYRQMVNTVPPVGANPAVFQYQLLLLFEPSIVIIRLLFYQSLEVFGVAGEGIEGEPLGTPGRPENA